MKWKLKSFDELTVNELYKLLQLRVSVFVVEQSCPYPEIDGHDQGCKHLFLEEDGQIVAYARLIPQGVLYESASIGRIVVDKTYRKSGYGRELLKKSIDIITGEWGETEIKLHAQVYLLDFYRSFDFIEMSEHYLEDGIPHVDMLLKR